MQLTVNSYRWVVSLLSRDEWTPIAYRNAAQPRWVVFKDAPISPLEARLAVANGDLIMVTRFDGDDRTLLVKRPKEQF